MCKVLRKSFACRRHSTHGVSKNRSNTGSVGPLAKALGQMCFRAHNSSDFRKVLLCLYSGLAT